MIQWPLRRALKKWVHKPVLMRGTLTTVWEGPQVVQLSSWWEEAKKSSYNAGNFTQRQIEGPWATFARIQTQYFARGA